MKRFLAFFGFAIALLASMADAQTALSFTVAGPYGASATWWSPQNIVVSGSNVQFCMNGYITKAAYTAGAAPLLQHCYNSVSGMGGSLIPSATVTANFPTSTTLANLSASAVTTALAVLDVAVANTQNTTYTLGVQLSAGYYFYDGSHIQKVTTAGWSGTSAPTWNHSGGTTTTPCSTSAPFNQTCAVFTDEGAAAPFVSYFNGATTTN